MGYRIVASNDTTKITCEGIYTKSAGLRQLTNLIEGKNPSFPPEVWEFHLIDKTGEQVA